MIQHRAFATSCGSGCRDLKSLGVDPAKLDVNGEGKARPMFDNRTKEGRQKNRLVEIQVKGFMK